MTNVEARMSKECLSSNDEANSSSFVSRYSCFFRHLSLGIRHYGFLLRLTNTQVDSGNSGRGSIGCYAVHPLSAAGATAIQARGTNHGYRKRHDSLSPGRPSALFPGRRLGHDEPKSAAAPFRGGPAGGRDKEGLGRSAPLHLY